MGEYEFRLLGPVELSARDGTAVHSVLQQTKRAALLAFLALGADRGRTRQELVELFWADRDDDGARHALSQAIYYLRRSLGQKAIDLIGERVLLNPSVVRVDVIEFRRLAAAGSLEAAVALVRGDLMEQFPLVSGFDRWLDTARESVRQEVLSVLDRLWQAATTTGDHARAIEWAERSCALAPYHEAPLRRLLSSLIADDQPVRAREAYDRFALRLEQDLELSPSDATRALLAPLDAPRETRTAPASAVGPDGLSATVRSEAAREVADAVAASREARADIAVIMPAGGSVAATTAGAGARGESNRVRVRRWLRTGIVAPAALGVLSLAFVVNRVSVSPDRQVSAASTVERVGVFPFLYRGHQELAYLGDGIPELIGTYFQSLDQVSLLDARALGGHAGTEDLAQSALGDAAAHARSLGASMFVVGSVIEAGGSIQVTARMHRTNGELIAAASGRANREDELFELVEGLVRQMAGAFPGVSDLERSAALTSRSLPALRHFFRGERLFRSGSYREAVREFDQAVEEDSTFALSMYRSAIALLWSSDADFEVARQKVKRALEHSDHATPHDVELFRALEAFLNGRLPEAERLYESILLRRPESVEAWFQLAETIFHYGGLHGRSVRASEEAWRRVIELNPHHHAALVHLSAIAALKRDPALDSLERKVNGDPDVPVPTPQVRALRVFSSGTEAERVRMLDNLSRHEAQAIATTAAYAARYLRDPAVGVRIAAVLTAAGRPASEQARGHLLLAHFALAQGRPTAAREALERAHALDPAQAAPHRLLLGTMPTMHVELRHSAGAQLVLPLGLELREPVAGFASFDGSVESGLALYAHALAYHRAGGEEGALVSASRQLRNAADDEPILRALGMGLLAERDLQEQPDGDVAHALADALRGVERWYEHLRTDHLRSLARERFILAEAAISMQRDHEAYDLLVPIGENAVAALPYTAPAMIRIGEIHERSGDANAALEAYRAVLDLWRDAEGPAAIARAEIAARVDALQRQS